MKNKSCQPITTLILLALSVITPVCKCCQDLLCYVDFIDTLTCEYRKDKDLNTTVSHMLTANWTSEESNDMCVVVECESNHGYICTMDMEDASVDDICTVTVTTNINGRYYSNEICKSFRIGDHFKPVPPVNLTVSLSEEYYFSWETLYDNHIFRNGELAYELSYKKDGESWLNQKTIQVLEDEKHVVLLRSSFQGDEQYVARIRAQPKSMSIYNGHWSEWSTSVSWTTPTDGKCCQDLLCYVDFIDTLTCEYRKDKDLNTTVSHMLTANWTSEESNDMCVVVNCESNHGYICTMDMEDASVDDICTVTVTTNINGRYYSTEICKPFRIGDHFKPVPPVNLTVSLSEEYYFSWETLYDNHIFRNGELAYELSYKKDGESWLNQKTIQVLEDEKHVVLLRSSFQGDEQYVARIRAQPKSMSIYNGHWSEWSTSVSWTTPTDGKKMKMQIGIISSIIAVLAFLGIIMSCFRYTPILWKKVWVMVPDPEPFFKPLYKGHEGDFKSWLGPSYIPFPVIPYEGTSTCPEVFEIDCHSSSNNVKIKKLLLPKSFLTEKNQIGRICGCKNKNPDTQCCSPCIASTTTTITTDGSINEEDSSRDDGYPSVNLDSGNMLDHLLDHGLHAQSTIPLKFGFHEHFQRSSMNILNLVSMPPEEWELQESSQEDDENVFYNDDNYNSLSPDSGDSGNFGYPKICLDMDTIDSGFVDSECGSPVDSDFGNGDIPTKPMNADPYNEDDEISERNYVQQWVPTAH